VGNRDIESPYVAPQRIGHAPNQNRHGYVDILEFQPESRALLSHPFAARHSERSVPTPFSFPEIGRIDLRVGTRSRRISLRRRQNCRMSTEPSVINARKHSNCPPHCFEAVGLFPRGLCRRYTKYRNRAPLFPRPAFCLDQGRAACPRCLLACGFL
jgi:hypothetical protein